jgi:hypothetical protein
MKASLRFEWPPPSAASQSKQLEDLVKLLDGPHSSNDVSPYRSAAPSSVDELIIRVGPADDFPDEDDEHWQLPSSLQLIVDELSRHERRQLRSLTLADFGVPFTETDEWQALGDVSELWSKLPELERLVLEGESMILGSINLPTVRDVAIRGTLRRNELASIAGASWPQIERLEILFGDPSYGAEGSIDDIRPILRGANLPRLRHLGLTLCAFAEDIVSDLEQFPVLAQLESLDFSFCELTDEAQDRLYAQRKKLAHLRVLRLGDGVLDWIHEDS